MPMTRHSGRSSFTFEIKRASRRTPEVLTLSKTSPTASSSLLDQVFGKASDRSDAAQFGRLEGPAADRASSRSDSLSARAWDTGERTGTSAEQPTRRVLPDLLAAPVSPLEERVQQEAEERAARRRAARDRTSRVEQVAFAEPSRATAETRVEIATSNDNAVAGADGSPAPTDITPSSEAGPVTYGKRTGTTRRSDNLRALCRRATKQGLPLPRLPAGSRWKRRLPWTCW